MRQPQEQVPVNHGRVHVEGNFRGFPNLFRCPLVAVSNNSDRKNPFVDSGEYQHFFVEHGSDNVLNVFGGERNAPEKLAVRGRDAHQEFLGLRHYLPDAAEIGDDGGCVGGTIPFPGPLHFARIHVEGGQGPVVRASHVGNHETPLGDRRHRSAEMRRCMRIL